MAAENDEAALPVQVRLSEARASFAQLYAGMSATKLELVRRGAIPAELDADEATADCPACGTSGVATGTRDVEWDYERLVPGTHHPMGTMWFEASDFRCRLCRLHLISPAELELAGMSNRWTESFDPLAYIPEIDEDVAYEIWRNNLRGRFG